MRKTSRKTTAKSNGHKPQQRRKESPRFDLIAQGREIERIFQRAVEHELSVHKRLGNPVAIWRDGKVVVIPPEEIKVPSER